MATAFGYNAVRGRCCECGTLFEMEDYVGTSLFGPDDIVCPGCGVRVHRVASCGRRR